MDTNDAGFFPVVRIHRDDLRDAFSAEEIATLTDDDLRAIAADMKAVYLESGDYRYVLTRCATAVLAGKRARQPDAPV